MDDKVTTSAVDKENRVVASILDPLSLLSETQQVEPITFDQSKIEERTLAAQAAEEPEYEVEYPNYKMELRGREVPFRPSPKKGTPLKYQRIPMCGHKFVPQATEPRHRNCESCWFTFFQVHGELTQSVEKVFQELGEGFLVKLKGRTFVTNFLKFMSTVANFKESVAVAQAAQERNVGTGRSEGSDAGESSPSAAGSSGTAEGNS